MLPTCVTEVTVPLVAVKLPTPTVPTRAALKVTVKLMGSLVTAAAVVSVTVLTVGAEVPNVKLVVPARLALAAASVATALTLIVPSTSLFAPVPKSPATKVTACAAPVPVTVLVTTLPWLSVNVTTVLAPVSAFTVTTPLV